MGQFERRARRFGVCAAFLVISSCGPSSDGDVTPPPPPPITSIVISGPTEIAAPGSVRMIVSVAWAGADTNTFLSISTTGPFGAAFEVRNNNSPRFLVVGAASPGSGSVTVSGGGKSGTIALTAKALSFQSISVTDGFGCALEVDGRAWCWGDNNTDELGVATTRDCDGSHCQYGFNPGNPTPLPVTTTKRFTSIVTSAVGCKLMYVTAYCGGTCAMTADHVPTCWGRVLPVGAPPEGATFTEIAPAAPSSYPTRTNGQTCGLVSTGTITCYAPLNPTSPANVATNIGDGHVFTSVAAGRFHACGVSDGDVYCWGSNLWGNLGTGQADTDVHPDPELASAPVKFSSVAVGDYSTCALSTGGTVYCWGLGYSATAAWRPDACRGTTTICQTTPRLTEGGETYVAFSRSETSARLCGLTSAGAVSCWNYFNEVPSPVTLSEPLTQISVASAKACGVSATRAAYCWTGNNQATRFGFAG